MKNTERKLPPIRTTIRGILEELKYESDKRIIELAHIIDSYFSKDELMRAADYSSDLLKYVSSINCYNEYMRNLKKEIIKLHKLLSTIFVNRMDKFIDNELMKDYEMMVEVNEISSRN